MTKFNSDKNYDLLIVCHEKDYNNLKFVIECANNNLDFESIHLIISDRCDYDIKKLNGVCSKPIYKHVETDVLKISKDKISYRPNWIYQQLLKMFQTVTNNDNYLVIDSDCLILKPLNFFNQDRQVFYFTRDQFHAPYFNFMSNVLGIEKQNNRSFISEIMMMNKNIINLILEYSNCKNVCDFLDLVYKHTNDNSYISEFELYGSFFYKNFNSNFEEKLLNYKMLGKNNESFNDEEITNIIINNENLDICTIHNWSD